MRCVINCMKIGKASGPSEVSIELFTAGEDRCLKPLKTYLMKSCSKISYQTDGC